MISKDFRAFIARGNIVDLAVAVVIGAAFGAVIKSFVDDVVMPPIGLLLGHVDFTNLFTVIKAGAKAPPPYATLADAKAAGAVTINWGLFIGSIVAFLIVAFAVFFAVRNVQRLQRQPAPPAPDTKSCPHCAMTIPLAAKRCPHCTSQL
ncbi:MAG TPA: large conductance mechanosensitive channel protein MscL [Gemmatimonadaceae bacterium]